MKLKLVSHNICHMGWHPIKRHELFPDKSYINGYEEDVVDLQKENWKTVYDGISADLIGIQEYCEWFDNAHTIRTEDQVFGPMGYTIAGESGIRLATKHPAELVIDTNFAPVSVRRWQKFYVTVEGRKIAVFNTHPMPHDAEVRQQEYAMLVEEFKKEETFLCFGDYNGRTADEYEIFPRSGFNMANTGIGTTKNGATCDNIVTSPNIHFSKILVLDTENKLSDHWVLYAEVEL